MGTTKPAHMLRAYQVDTAVEGHDRSSLPPRVELVIPALALKREKKREARSLRELWRPFQEIIELGVIIRFLFFPSEICSRQ